ncbi:hypothetical protein ACFVZJ_21155 [Streptomyces sp. NPDC058322]|uniref:hypothetical protein n=1 Tax=Streptomyces sp. NPDC058322 TaxID=3346446 RepID=UPI0036E5022A
MTAPLSPQREAEIRTDLDAIPAPPWRWIGSRHAGGPQLVTDHSGRQYVLRAAKPTDHRGDEILDPETYSVVYGDLEFRDQHKGEKYSTMRSGDALAIGRTEYDPDSIVGVANPVARWLEASAQYATDLLAEVARLRAELEGFREQRNAVFKTNEELLARVERAGLARLQAENETRTIARESDALRARVAELENALAATGRSLSSFIFDSDDPGTDALGAQWLYHQAMPQADDPFAQPRAFRSSVFSEAANVVEAMDGHTPDGHRERPQSYLDGHSDGLQDAAEALEKLADQVAEGSEAAS